MELRGVRKEGLPGRVSYMDGVRIRAGVEETRPGCQRVGGKFRSHIYETVSRGSFRRAVQGQGQMPTYR